ncbi:MAG: SUF system NifU family Fe-S cluster assembly protein [Alphaproteobacteria bacterium]|jgi:nitrogen fixation NifU-like protein|nr:SUF system NifU family Fe-S cluster assembly protein [Alphaproteobacteria bacterium]
MSDDLRELYQELVLDHGRHPRNRRHPDSFNHEAFGKNPMCGDALVVYLMLDPQGVVTDCAFMGEGCAISMASASLMTEIVRGKTVDQANALFAAFQHLATGEGEVDESVLDEDDLDRLQALSGVRQFPIRVKCATLAWHTLHAAMQGEEMVSTE